MQKAQGLPAGPLPKMDVPLYQQVAKLLRDAIANGLVPVGGSLPTEHELASRFNVSRVTIRNALQILHQERLILRHRAKGTIVVAQEGNQGTGWDIGNLEDIVAFGRFTELRIASYKPENIPEVQKIFKVGRDQLCFVLRGTRIMDGEKFGVTAIHLPPTVGSRLSEHDFDSATIFPVLQRRLGISLSEAVQEVSAEIATPQLARTFGEKLGAPILKVTRLYLTREGMPVEYAVTHYRASTFTLKNRLRHIGLRR